MSRIMTPQQLKARLAKLGPAGFKEVRKGMVAAVGEVEGEAKKFCTPGHSPYSKAPYTDDRDTQREPPHMRDTIKGKVQMTKTNIKGTIGTPKHYALAVHDGTKKMAGRPFLYDAIRSKRKRTTQLIKDSLKRGLELEAKQ